MGIIERARELRLVIEQNAESMLDEQAAQYPELFQAWNGTGTEYEAGNRVTYKNELYKVIQAHTSQTSWTPEEAQSLFAKILPGQEETPIGEWQQPDSTNPYMTGDKVIYNGTTYISVIDNNIWSPDDYPEGWEVVE